MSNTRALALTFTGDPLQYSPQAQPPAQYRLQAPDIFGSNRPPRLEEFLGERRSPVNLFCAYTSLYTALQLSAWFSGTVPRNDAPSPADSRKRLLAKHLLCQTDKARSRHKDLRKPRALQRRHRPESNHLRWLAPRLQKLRPWSNLPLPARRPPRLKHPPQSREFPAAQGPRVPRPLVGVASPFNLARFWETATKSLRSWVKGAWVPSTRLQTGNSNAQLP